MGRQPEILWKQKEKRSGRAGTLFQLLGDNLGKKAISGILCRCFLSPGGANRRLPTLPGSILSRPPGDGQVLMWISSPAPGTPFRRMDRQRVRTVENRRTESAILDIAPDQLPPRKRHTFSRLWKNQKTYSSSRTSPSSRTSLTSM